MTEFTTYGIEVANGDPIVVYTDSGKALCLGTGFEYVEDLKYQLLYTMNTGHRTADITPENARELHNAERIDIFTLSAVLEK